MASSFLRFLDRTQRRTTICRTPLDEWSACRRGLYLTAHTKLTTNIHVPGGIRTLNLSRREALDRAATESGKHFMLSREIKGSCLKIYEKWINKYVTDVTFVNSRIYFLFFNSYAITFPVGKNLSFSMGQVFGTYWGIPSIYLCRKDLPKRENFCSGNLSFNIRGLISLHTAISTNNTHFIKFLL